MLGPGLFCGRISQSKEKRARCPHVEDERPKVDMAVGTIIGVVIGVLLLLVIIIVAVFMIHKQRQNAENGDGPPKYKPPPPAKAGGSTEMLNKSQEQLESQPLGPKYYETTGEPITDLDGNEEGNGYTVGATSGWEDSAQGPNGETQSETLPPYSDTPEHEASRDKAQDPGALSPSAHEGSFVSPAMYV